MIIMINDKQFKTVKKVVDILPEEALLELSKQKIINACYNTR